MKDSHHIHRGSALVPWCVCIAAGLSLLGASAARAQVDPVEAYQEALEKDLDQLVGPTRVRALDARRVTLNKLADQMTTAGALSRAVRSPDSRRLRELKDRDNKLEEIDRDVQQKMLARFVDVF